CRKSPGWPRPSRSPARAPRAAGAAACTGTAACPPTPPPRAPPPCPLQQEPHALGDERALEERRRVLMLARGLSAVHRGDVGRELGLLKRAFQNIGVGDRDLAPALHGLPLRGWSGTTRAA